MTVVIDRNILWRTALRELVDAIVRVLDALVQVIAVMRDLVGARFTGPLRG